LLAEQPTLSQQLQMALARAIATQSGTLYAIHYTLYAIRYTLYAVRYTLYAIRYTLYAIRYALCNMHRAGYMLI
jgi:hypothetical protein